MRKKSPAVTRFANHGSPGERSSTTALPERIQTIKGSGTAGIMTFSCTCLRARICTNTSREDCARCSLISLPGRYSSKVSAEVRCVIFIVTFSYASCTRFTAGRGPPGNCCSVPPTSGLPKSILAKPSCPAKAVISAFASGWSPEIKTTRRPPACAGS